jgi:hypothetical protein
MQAIETKYFGPTNTRGGRVRASAQAGKLSVAYDHGLNVEDNHAAAAIKLAKKLGWTSYGDLHGGGNAKGDGFCFVFCPSRGKKK